MWLTWNYLPGKNVSPKKRKKKTFSDITPDHHNNKATVFQLEEEKTTGQKYEMRILEMEVSWANIYDFLII